MSGAASPPFLLQDAYDANALLTSLHGAVVRLLGAACGAHVEGIHQGLARCRPRLSAATARRCRDLEAAVALLRHIDRVRADAFLSELKAELDGYAARKEPNVEQRKPRPRAPPAAPSAGGGKSADGCLRSLLADGGALSDVSPVFELSTPQPGSPPAIRTPSLWGSPALSALATLPAVPDFPSFAIDDVVNLKRRGFTVIEHGPAEAPAPAVQHGAKPMNGFEGPAGDQPPLGLRDPLGFAKDGAVDKFVRQREVDVQHGRASMIAALGDAVPEYGNGLLGLGSIGVCVSSTDPAMEARRLAVELAVGRLALVATIGMFIQDGLTGSAWGDWALYLVSPVRAFVKFKMRRAVYAQHGRVSMVAAIGYVREGVTGSRMFLRDGLIGSAWGDWALHTDAPVRAFKYGLGVQSSAGFWDPAGFCLAGIGTCSIHIGAMSFRGMEGVASDEGIACMLQQDAGGPSLTSVPCASCTPNGSAPAVKARKNVNVNLMRTLFTELVRYGIIKTTFARATALRSSVDRTGVPATRGDAVHGPEYVRGPTGTFSTTEKARPLQDADSVAEGAKKKKTKKREPLH